MCYEVYRYYEKFRKKLDNVKLCNYNARKARGEPACKVCVVCPGKHALTEGTYLVTRS